MGRARIKPLPSPIRRINIMASSGSHGKPLEGMTCLCTWDDITEEEYCEYQTAPSMDWHPCLYSAEVVEQLLASQFQNYVDNVQKSDCAKELTRLLTSGPPIWLHDKQALPLPEGETHVVNLWFCRDGREVSAKLKGALVGEEREALWDNLKQFLALANEKKEEVSEQV